MNKEILKQIFPEMVEAVERGLCPMCGHEVNINDFRDDLSKKEFEISGLCQNCQDDTFK